MPGVAVTPRLLEESLVKGGNLTNACE